MIEHVFSKFFIRQGHPDFLDLSWNDPLTEWYEKTPRYIEVERGLSRHIVVFVYYPDSIYAIKELPKQTGEREYQLLRNLEKMHLPSVVPVGFGEYFQGDRSVLITQFLKSSLPYRILFMQPGFDRYQDNLLDAMAMLLVRLHIKGFFWGDCSLSNTLFRRDVGELQAYLVDAETSKIFPSLSDGQRNHDLMIMEENVAGELMDLSKIVNLSDNLDVFGVSTRIRGRYEHLWNELTLDEVIEPDMRYKIHERITRINNLGFTVDEIQLISTEGGKKITMRPFVSDRDYHSHQLHSLTGIAAEEKQARILLNEINEMKMRISPVNQRDLHNIPFNWMNELYKPTIDKLGLSYNDSEAPEIYCEVLEHKRFLSEKAKKDVGRTEALEDYINNIFNNRRIKRIS